MQGIRVEGLSFLEALLTGMTVCCAYACLCLLRRAVRHTPAAIAAEDLLFWIFSAFWLLGYFYRENSGILRGYLFAGFLLGALACHFSVSRFFVRWGTEILRGCGKILSMPLKGIKKATKRLKFRMFRFRIYWYNRFHVDKGPRGRWFHNRDGKHEKREKQKQPKNSRSPAE